MNSDEMNSSEMNDNPNHNQQCRSFHPSKGGAAMKLILGNRYKWQHDKSPVLVYVGTTETGWHQFEKISEPGVVWCEVTDEELPLMEEVVGNGLPSMGDVVFTDRPDGLHIRTKDGRMGIVPHGLVGSPRELVIKGVMAGLGLSGCLPSTVDTPPKLSESDKANFATLQDACDNGDLALVSAIRKSDRKPVALVCAMQENGDGTFTPVPFAVMVEGNPFELFEDPTQL